MIQEYLVEFGNSYAADASTPYASEHMQLNVCFDFFKYLQYFDFRGAGASQRSFANAKMVAAAFPNNTLGCAPSAASFHSNGHFTTRVFPSIHGFTSHASTGFTAREGMRLRHSSGLRAPFASQSSEGTSQAECQVCQGYISQHYLPTIATSAQTATAKSSYTRINERTATTTNATVLAASLVTVLLLSMTSSKFLCLLQASRSPSNDVHFGEMRALGWIYRIEECSEGCARHVWQVPSWISGVCLVDVDSICKETNFTLRKGTRAQHCDHGYDCSVLGPT